MGPRPRPPAQYPSEATNSFGSSRLGDAARRELLAFPAEYLGELPVPVRVELRGATLGDKEVLAVLIGRRFAYDLRGQGQRSTSSAAVFDSDELRAIAIGVQSERLRSADFRAFCLRKRIEPDFRVTEEAALDGGRAECTGARTGPWSLDRVLRWLELEPAGLEYLGAEPALLQAARAA